MQKLIFTTLPNIVLANIKLVQNQINDMQTKPACLNAEQFKLIIALEV